MLLPAPVANFESSLSFAVFISLFVLLFCDGVASERDKPITECETDKVHSFITNITCNFGDN